MAVAAVAVKVLPRWKSLGLGIYQDHRTGRYYERPRINGRRTWRVLQGRTLKLAREEMAARRTDQARSTYGMARNPYAPTPTTFRELFEVYKAAGCPTRRHQKRTGKSLADTLAHLKFLGPFWNDQRPHQIRIADCLKYRNSRADGNRKTRAIDLELTTLSNILDWAIAAGKLESNPIRSRPRFHRTIRHCRETMPADARELHELAAHLFEQRKSEVLGWQLLLEAMTGCRTSEVLKLRWNAGPGQPGHIEGDWLWLARSKGGVNPFVKLHPALKQTLDALKRWRQWRYPTSPWFLPGLRHKGQHPVTACSLNHALAIAGPLIARAHRTSHGLRAYYVTVRRSQGISDAQIAAEIGDKSGASIIVSTYGAIPPNWQGRAGMDWLQKGAKPAWSVLAGMPTGILIKTRPRAKSVRTP